MQNRTTLAIPTASSADADQASGNAAQAHETTFASRYEQASVPKQPRAGRYAIGSNHAALDTTAAAAYTAASAAPPPPAGIHANSPSAEAQLAISSNAVQAMPGTRRLVAGRRQATSPTATQAAMIQNDAAMENSTLLMIGYAPCAVDMAEEYAWSMTALNRPNPTTSRTSNPLTSNLARPVESASARMGAPLLWVVPRTIRTSGPAHTGARHSYPDGTTSHKAPRPKAPLYLKGPGYSHALLLQNDHLLE